MSVSSPLVWIASYPRSGNTFTRILLANYLSGAQEPYPLNKLLDFVPSDTDQARWSRLLPPREPPYLVEEIWRARPAFIRAYRKERAGAGFVGLKTHSGNLEVFGEPGFEFEHGDRVLYIVRNPLDIAVSYSDYNDRDLDAAIELICASGTTVLQSGTRLEVRGSWTENVSSWIGAPPCPLMVVKYEDMCADPEEALRHMLAFLGQPLDIERVSRAAAFSRFDSVRRQEEHESFIETPDIARSGRFFREGRPGQWRTALSADQARRLADRCRPIMERLDYPHPDEAR